MGPWGRPCVYTLTGSRIRAPPVTMRWVTQWLAEYWQTGSHGVRSPSVRQSAGLYGLLQAGEFKILESSRITFDGECDLVRHFLLLVRTVHPLPVAFDPSIIQVLALFRLPRFRINIEAYAAIQY